jgi:heptosyltransferase II
MSLAPQLFLPDLGPAPTAAPLLEASKLGPGGLLLRVPNWLGDGVMALPAVARLRSLLPAGVPLRVLTLAKLQSFWQAVPGVDEVLTFARGRLQAAELAEVRQRACAAAVIFPNSFGSAWDLWRAGVPQVLGRGGRGRGLLLHHRLPAWHRRPGQDRWHQARHDLELAWALGSRDWGTDFPALKPQLTEAEATTLAPAINAPGKLLVLAPGAAYGPAKQWPVSHFQAVARAWQAEMGQVAVIGAPGEENAAAAAIADLPGALNLAGQTNLRQLMALLGGAGAALVNDSGAMHLGAAMGGRGVAIFGSTDPLATGPLGGRWVVMRRPPPCAPCLKRVCPLKADRYLCLTAIQPAEVLATLRWVAEAP